MEGLSFDKFVKKIYIKAPLKILFHCWSTASGFESWFLRSAVFERDGKPLDPDQSIQAGDRYSWMWYNWDGVESGEVLEANGKDMLVLTFANENKLRVELEDRGSHGVLVTLTQFDIPTDEKTKLEIYNGCSNGWTFWLANLKAKLEHGIMLNETEVDLTADPLAGWTYVNM